MSAASPTSSDFIRPDAEGRPRRHQRLLDASCLLGLAALFLLSIAVVGTDGNFPLADDWSFADTVRRLVTELRWRPHDWTSMPLVTHSLLAALPCALSSCSFEVLRMVTLGQSLALCLLSFCLFRAAGAATATAVVAAIAVSWNPITFVLSFTFMTDIAFELLSVATAITALLFFRRRTIPWLFGCAALATLATLCRQTGLALGVGFAVAACLLPAASHRARILSALLPLAASAVALGAFEGWMRHAEVLPMLYHARLAQIALGAAHPGEALLAAWDNLVAISLYLGLFTVPVGIVWSATARLSEGRIAAVAATIVSGSVATTLLVRGVTMPLGGNFIHRQGVGPLTLHDTYILGADTVRDLPPALWLGVTAASVLGLWILAFAAFRLFGRVLHAGTRLSVSEIMAVFGLGAGLATAGPFLVAGYFDRYLTAIVPLLCLVLLSGAESQGTALRLVRTGSGIVCTLLVSASVACAHDYLSWNRARWEAIRELERSLGVTPEQMDAGFEYHGFRTFKRDYSPSAAKSWWWVMDDRFLLAFGPLPGTETVSAHPFSAFVLRSRGSIHVLKRIGRKSQAQPQP